jgi:hypothetical protein
VSALALEIGDAVPVEIDPTKRPEAAHLAGVDRHVHAG